MVYELKWMESPDALLSMSKSHTDYNVFPLYRGPYPLVADAWDKTNGGLLTGLRNEVMMSSARVFTVTQLATTWVVTVVCMLRGGHPVWTAYCGDLQVSGQAWGEGKALADKLRKEGVLPQGVANELAAESWVGKATEVESCAYMRMLNRSGNFCSHTQAALAQVTVQELHDMAQELKDWNEGKNTFASVPLTGPDMSPEEAAFYDAAFIQHVLLAGDRGSGKTYLARQAANRLDAVYLEMQMHPSMEAWEFRAHDRAWNGKVFTVLGPFAEAVDWIQKGKKVVLCMDEFLNMNPMYTTVINTPLSLTADDTYLIETGRLIDLGDGTARQERVEVPADMFWVVATSNIGARYNIDKMTPSVRARFQIIPMNTNADRTKQILLKNLAKYEMPEALADMFRKLIDTCTLARSDAEEKLDEEVTTRFACNVIRACHLKAKRDHRHYTDLKAWLPVIRAQCMLESAQVVNFETGPLDQEQLDYFKGFVEKCFRIEK